TPRKIPKGSLAVAAALQATGFEVVSGLDLSKADMERSIRGFLARLREADVALLFYAGHGLQASNRNYLMPVEAKLKDEADLDFEFTCFRGARSDGARSKEDPDFSRRLPRQSTCA